MKMYDPSVRWLVICGAVFFAILGIKAMGSLISSGTQAAAPAAAEVPSVPLDTTAAMPENSLAVRPSESPRGTAAVSGAAPAVAKPSPSTTPDQRQAWLAVTNELGFALVEGSPFERTATFVVTDADEANSRFSGVGRLRHKVPFVDATFAGKVSSTGAVTIQFDFESKPIVFDRFTPSGGLGQSVRGGFGLQPLNEYESEKYAEYDSLIESIVDATAGSLAVEAIKFKDRAAVMQGLQYRAVPAIVARQLGYELAKPDRLVDGEIRASWRGDEGWLALRYRQPQRANGALIVGGDTTDPAVTMTVNGTLREPLTVGGIQGMTVIRFSDPIDVIDLHFDIFGRGFVVEEIFLLD